MSEKKVYAAFETLNIPTYVTGKPNDLPLFFENRGHQGACGKVFPMPYVENLSDNPVPKDYTVGILENEYIRIETLPALGGKIRRAIDKTTGYDFIYHNPVIKPAMIGLAGPWVSGGIEFNWPQHHRPTTLAPVQAKIEEYPNGEKTVWMGECEPFARTKGIVGVTVCPGRSYIKAKIRVYNRTPQPQSFMWWANLAVEINDNYRRYQWAWTYRLILDYYQLDALTLDDAARIKQDYITARRAWIAEIRKDAEKEYRMGDVEKEVLDNFINNLDHEVDFEN